MRFYRTGLLAIVGCSAVLAGRASADVKLPDLFSDNMVLQRGINAPVWGTADPGEAVTVTLGDQKQTATADNNGKWMVKLAPLTAGGPFDMTVSGKNSLTRHNVAVGEVWVCSGQSNMEFVLRGAMNAQQEIADANYPMIRSVNIVKKVADQPQTEARGQWAVCTPQAAGGFTAVGYFFGRELHKALGVPVGLIHSSWGGTPAEAWTNHATLQNDPELKTIQDAWAKRLERYPQEKADYDKKLADWQVEADKARAAGQPQPRRPAAPQGADSSNYPSNLYNGMIAPLIPYGIKGVIWYQGESNAGNGKLYQKLFPAMIQNWRQDWGEGDFPFLFVQLANFMKREEQPSESGWAELREAQLKTLALPHTGMATIIDVGEADNIHPKNKQAVGHRLALAALATEYGQNVEYSGPIFDSMTIEGNKIRLRFKHLGGGLTVGAEGIPALDESNGNQKLVGFAIAGADKKFVWADAKLDGDSVVVSSDQVPNPVAVRYAWGNNPAANLYNKAGLPASPFRTDDWPPLRK